MRQRPCDLGLYVAPGDRVDGPAGETRAVDEHVLHDHFGVRVVREQGRLLDDLAELREPGVLRRVPPGGETTEGWACVLMPGASFAEGAAAGAVARAPARDRRAL